jgi:hypothetical protein
VEQNHERVAKRIRASSRSDGSLVLAPDSGDAVARARLLLDSWGRDGPSPAGTRATLARTHAEPVPYAPVALALGIPCHVEQDGLVFDDQRLVEVVAAAGTASASAPVLPALRAAALDAGLDASMTGSLLAWAAPYGDLAAFRAALAARAARRRELAAEHATLTLATMHGTKGLEWDHVACVGHDEGAFPSGRALREAAEPARVLEEERRLAYVAWTRARRTLTIVYDPGAPSVFLRDAFDPDELA